MEELGRKLAEAMSKEDSPFKKMMEAMKSEGPMPELKEKSDFEKELSKKTYPKAKAPEGKQTFRWDFSRKYKFVYDYEQKVKADSSLGFGQTMQCCGKLSVKAKGDHTADFIFSDLDTEHAIITDEDSSETEKSMKVPANINMTTTVIQGVTEDSKIPEGDYSGSEFMKLPFPLPAEALGVGESSSVPGKMPFNAFGSLLWVKGGTTVTLKDYVTIDSRICAQFDIKVDISEMDVPEELPGKYAVLTKGVGMLYFDIEDKCFHSGELALIMSVRTETPFPGRMTMDADCLIRFTRNRKKEKEVQKK